MYAIFGEDDSDAQTLKQMVLKLTGRPHLKIHASGYGGAGNLKNACWKDLQIYHKKGFQRFIIYHDADTSDPRAIQALRTEMEAKTIKMAGLTRPAHIAIPVQAMEAWILADVEAVTAMFRSWKPSACQNPEAISNPKHALEKMSEIAGTNRKRYDHRLHNPKTIKHLDLDKVAAKCPSFQLFRDFVLSP